MLRKGASFTSSSAAKALRAAKDAAPIDGVEFSWLLYGWDEFQFEAKLKEGVINTK